MRALILSPLLWRMVGGFAVGTALTFGLAPPVPAPSLAGATVEIVS